jgi:hypothetical protein
MAVRTGTGGFHKSENRPTRLETVRRGRLSGMMPS